MSVISPLRLGPLPPRLRNLLRYASASAVSTTVGLSTLGVLLAVGHWSPTWSNVVATAVGTVPSFELNRRWVWCRHGRSSVVREIAPFGALCLLELVASTLAVRTTAAWSAHAGWSHGVRTGADLAANVTAYGVLWIVQYVVLDRLLFAGHGNRPPASPGDPVGMGASPEVQRTLCTSSANVEEAAPGWSR